MKLTNTELIIACLILLALVYVLFGRDHVEHLTLPTPPPTTAVIPPATPATPSAGNIQAALAALNTNVGGNVPASPGGLNTNPIAMPSVPSLGATSGVLPNQPTIGALNTNTSATAQPLGGMANAVANTSTTTLPGLNNPARTQVAGSSVTTPPVPGIVPPTPAPPLKLPTVPATPVK